MKIETLDQAITYLNTYIPEGTQYKFPGDVGLKRTQYLLTLLDNPQNKLKVIHIAGTSGKGSTAYYLSYILTALGKHVGLHVSPHLIDFRERFQIDNNYINEDEFCSYLSETIPFIEQVEKDGMGKPTFFEITIALVYYIFWKKKVDYAVIETGLGGTFDATNVVDSADKVAVITKIGFDHTEILGKTLSAIASQKAGIIHTYNNTFTLDQKKNALDVIKKRVEEKKGLLYIAEKNKNFMNVEINNNILHFRFQYFDIEMNVKLSTLGLYQVENCTLALVVSAFLSRRDDFIYDKKSVMDSLKVAHLIGRMDVIKIQNPKSKIQTLIIDGAHNPQKMLAFTSGLIAAFPGQQFNFLVSMKKGKDYKNTLKYIAPIAENIIVSRYDSSMAQGFPIHSESPEALNKIIRSLHIINHEEVNDLSKALETLLESKSKYLVVTGSLYLVGEIYKLLAVKI